jgi:hypothetical protein
VLHTAKQKFDPSSDPTYYRPLYQRIVDTLGFGRSISPRMRPLILVRLSGCRRPGWDRGGAAQHAWAPLAQLGPNGIHVSDVY